MTRTITITKLRRPSHQGMITHHVRLPGWLRPAGTGSLEDARRMAAGFQPRPGDTVEIVECSPAEAKRLRRPSPPRPSATSAAPR